MRILLIVASGLMLSLGASNLPAQVGFGGQVSLGSDSEIGIGARVTFGLDSLLQAVVPDHGANHLEGIISFDYFFPDDLFVIQIPEERVAFEISYFEINANLALSFVVPNYDRITPYLGGGLNIARTSVNVDLGTSGSISSSETDIGLNLLAGSKFGSGQVRPFAELRLEVKGDKQVVIAAGIVF